MDYKASIDKLVICGFCSDNIRENLRFNPLNKGMQETANKRYHYNYWLEGGGFIQILHESNWNESFTKVKSEDETPKKGVKPMRIEFNPNNYLDKNLEKYMIEILKNMRDCHVTRRDIAFDFIGIDLNDYFILDMLSRKQHEYRTGLYQTETLYIGADDSDLLIRFYDKAKQMKIKDQEWWRIESQMRGNYAETYFMNPFASITILRELNFEKYDWETRAKLEYLIKNPKTFSSMSQNSRLKYKKMLTEDIEMVELKISDMFNESVHDLNSELESWLGITEKQGRYYRGTIKPIRQEKVLSQEEKEKYKAMAEKIKEEKFNRLA